MKEVLENVNLSVDDEFDAKTRSYNSPVIEIKAFTVGEVILTSPGDIDGDNPFGDDFL